MIHHTKLFVRRLGLHCLGCWWPVWYWDGPGRRWRRIGMDLSVADASATESDGATEVNLWFSLLTRTGPNSEAVVTVDYTGPQRRRLQR